MMKLMLISLQILLGGFTVAYDTFLSQKIDELTDEELIEQRKVFFQSFAI